LFKKKLDAVKNLKEFKFLEETLKFQSKTFYHKKFVRRLHKLEKTIGDNVKVDDMPSTFYISNSVNEFKNMMKISEYLLKGEINEAYDQLFEDINNYD